MYNFFVLFVKLYETHTAENIQMTSVFNTITDQSMNIKVFILWLQMYHGPIVSNMRVTIP